MMADPLVVTIVLNNNRREDTLTCLASLEKTTYQNHKIIVLDNATTDGSIEAVISAFPHVEIVELTRNLGYAGNNNIGINIAREKGADWVFVLNEDTRVDPACITEMVAVGERDATVGVVGPMVYHFNEPDVIQSAGGILSQAWDPVHLGQNETDQGQYSAPHSVDWISGCAIMVRRTFIEQNGLLDERFFCYEEETEWCLRGKKSDWRIIHVPQAKIWHKGVQRDYTPKPYVTYYITRNKFLMLNKHQAPARIWVSTWAQTLRTLVSWTVKPKWRNKHEHRNAMWHGALDYLRRRWGEWQQPTML
jgi:GT2 family glycosyltransferase